MPHALSQQASLRYIRAKIDQLLTVMGTLPLRPEELDDETLIALDPIGIIADSFAQVIAHLNETNDRLDLAQSEIRAILDTLGAAVVVLNLNDHIEDCNRQALEWLFGGADRAQVIGKLAGDACDLSHKLASIRAQADGAPRTANLYGRDMQIVASKVLDDAGLHSKTVMLFSDITLQKETERHLRLYSEVFSHVGEGIMITNADNRIIEVNDAVLRITGYSREELIGNMPSSLKSGLHEPSFYEDLWRRLHKEGYWQGEIFDRTRDGRVIPLLVSISDVHDAAGLVSHYIAVITDISSIKETQTRLDFLAHHDALTELPNRLLFSDRLHHAIERARREDHSVALLFIDLDHFKNINDSLGHHIGDLLLIEVAHLLKGMVRRADTVARLGGDEFVILMESSTSQTAAPQLAEKIISALKQPMALGGLDLHIGCSIGITIFPEDGDDAGTLLKNADAAMYRAKEAGRDGHVRYSADLSAAMHEKMELDNALRRAVRDSEFVLHYQPIIDITRGKVVACEALIRWPDAPATACTPDRFIPVAEETRLIVPLGEWILREALQQMRSWHDAGLILDYISVNISAVQLAQPDFTDRVIAQLADASIAGSKLQIELTENMLMGDIELCSWVLSQLREHGIRIAIDDFGTGYSSLSYLKQLPIDNLKIDRSFVSDIPGDANDCAIAAAIIGLAKTLGLDAIAEGIETVEQQDFLVRTGCDKVQGYLHARPLPAADFASFTRGFDAQTGTHCGLGARSMPPI